MESKINEYKKNNFKIVSKIIIIALLLSSLAGWSQDAIANDFFDKAYNKANKGDDKGAIADYSKAIQKYPKLTEAYLNRAVSKQNIEDHKGALEDVNKALTLDPKKAD